MFGFKRLLTAFAALGLLVSCGSGDLDVYDPNGRPGQTTAVEPDAGGGGESDDGAPNTSPDSGNPALGLVACYT